MSQLEHGDHPELDTSKHLDQHRMQKQQSLIEAIQWDASLGRLEVSTDVMTLASFRGKPREAHLDRARRVVSYIVKFKMLP